MIRHSILFFVLSLFSLSLFPQGSVQELDPYLESLLDRSSPERELDLFVRGDPARIDRYCRANGGIFKFQAKGYSSIRLSAGKVRSLKEQGFVRRILLHVGRGHALNDTMRVRNRIQGIQEGTGLPRSYRGKDVIIGYIDSGLDLDHPDFQDSTGRTRVLTLWDQTFSDSSNTPSTYGYGREWDSTDINAGNCPHVDQPGFNGHGTSVASVGSGNERATGNHRGGAPRSDLIIVSNDFGAPNWTATIVDAVHYILERADSIGKPVVINTSVGTYSGSHDARDPAALMIDSLLRSRDESMLVAAAGNAGHFPFHLEHQVGADTTFTWFEYENNTKLGHGAVYFEAWADTSDLDSVEYAVGADRVNPSYLYRGRTPFHTVQNNLDSNIVDTLLNGSGDTIAIVETYAQKLGGRYRLQVHLEEPDSNQYYFRFMSTGSGRFDVWSASFLGTSPIVDSSSIPSQAQFPDIADYQAPDPQKTIVSSWTCSEEVLTVANYVGRTQYPGLDSTIQTVSGTTGAIANNSSRGPTRDGRMKPDVAATGKVLMTAGKLSFIDQLIQNEPYKVHPDSMHMRNGGTSVASPVVASIAALYLQHCPRADQYEVMQAIRSTALTDTFTGTVPNHRWGHGKVNGHAAISSSLYQASLSFTDSSVCGGPIELSTQNSYPEYHWNEGSSGVPLSVDSSGGYHSMVRDSSGCPAWTDTAHITVHPLPSEPTLYQQGDSLFTDLQGVDYQWFRDGMPIAGADSQGYRIENAGAFHLMVEDSNGCRNTSDTINALPSGSNEKRDPDATLTPNPVEDLVVLRFDRPLDKEVRYELIDAKGHTQDRGRIPEGAGSERIGMKGKASGLYILRWRTDEGRTGRKKLIKR